MFIKKTLIGLIAIAAFTPSCKKESTDCSFIEAKIIRYDCDRVILQLTSDTLIGDAVWTDVQTGVQYSNVVSYYNTCRIAQFTNGEMISIYVDPQKSNEFQPGECFQCLAISQDPPETKVVFEYISKTPCNGQAN